MELLRDKDANVRRAVVLALGSIALTTGFPPEGMGEDPVMKALIKILRDDENPSVRASAAKCLGYPGPWAKAFVPALKEALKDEDSSVREAAAAALKKIE